MRQHYGIDVETYFPDANELQGLVRRHGVNMFYESVPMRLTCCDVRKVRPLVKVLHGLDAWVTGLRRDQWATRSNIRKIELDHDHGGLVKVNPLADWTDEEVWDYIRDNDVPYHPLYDQGYQSIGCAPCTRPGGAGRERALRPLVVGEERAEGVRHALRGRDGRIRARAGGARRKWPGPNDDGQRETRLEAAEAEVLAADAAEFAAACRIASAGLSICADLGRGSRWNGSADLVPTRGDDAGAAVRQKARPSNRAVLHHIRKTPRGRAAGLAAAHKIQQGPPRAVNKWREVRLSAHSGFTRWS